MHASRTGLLALAIGMAACTGSIDAPDPASPGAAARPGGSRATGSPGSPSAAGGATSGGAPGTTAGAGAPPGPAVAQPGSRGVAEFTCNGAPTTPPPPRRLWRLSARQYVNTVAVALTGVRGGAPMTPPADLVAPLDPLGNVYAFRTYSGTHSLTGFEFGRSVTTSEDVARKMVAAVRDGTCWPATPNGAPTDACIDTLIKDRGAILFRRPLTADEVTRYGGYARANAATFGRDEALGIAFQAMLLAPQFLFLTEFGDPVAGAKGVARLNPYEVAAAISYSLTDAPADAMLWDAASKGALATPEQIAAHITRIANSPSATALAEFPAQYFKVDRVLDVAKSIENPCEYGRERILQDARLLIANVLSTNRNKDFFKTLLTTTVGFAGCDSYKEYGLARDPKSDAPQMLPATQRAGLLTHPAFLAGLAAFDDTQPVKRGRFINESLLCRAVPDAPLDVVAKLPADMVTTMRERLAVHAKEARCAACHALMDPLGLALEQYDAYGRYRSTQYGKTLDPSGTLTGAGDADGSFKDGVDLARRLAGSVTVEQCFIRNGFRYFMGRPEDAYDDCALSAAAKAYRGGSGDLAAAITALYTSASFLNRSF